MHEFAAAPDALFRVVAEGDAGDVRKIDLAIDARVFDAGRIRQPDRLFDAIGRARVGRHDGISVGGFRGAGDLRLEAGVRVELLEERRHGIGRVADARQVAHAQHVGFQFLFARIALQDRLGAERRQVPGRPRHAGDLADNTQDRHADVGGHRLTVALRRMPGGDMADFVGQHAGHFGFGFGHGKKAAGNVDITAGQREGVDFLVVQYREGEFQVGQLGVARDRRSNLRHVFG